MTDVNECLSSPCQNGGLCTDIFNGYNCTCAAGYTGSRCETDIDDCASGPCTNGGTCSDGVNTFSCSCPAGFTGNDCSEVILQPLTSYLCTFDDADICNWRQAADDETDFLWLDGQCGGYGPPGDHTRGPGGHYLCLEGSTTPRDGKARLTSPYFRATSDRTLRFWYYKNSFGSSGISVYVTSGDSLGNAVWTSPSGREDEWRMAEVDITGMSRFRVVFESEKVGFTYADLAIDDVSIEDPASDECQSNPCRNGGVCVDGRYSYTCTCTPAWAGLHCELPRGSTDFEDDLSAFMYTQATDDDMDWLRNSGGTPTSGTGPSSDHTTGNGHYMYAKASFINRNKVARLESPVIQPTAGSCLQFFYHMYGSQIGTLSVFVRPDGQPLGNSVWSRTGEQGDLWQKGEYEVVMQQPFQVVFEAAVGSYFRGDIALDDVLVEIGQCDSPDFDDCLSNPCQNGGTCQDGLGQYMCTCPSGWHGTQCELDNDACASYPCRNGGTCNDGPTGYVCACAPGWAGTDCEREINECEINPCYNGAVCIDQVNGFYCNCTDGWEGFDCLTDINECLSQPCMFGGACTNGVNGVYTCSCQPGYQGQDCEQVLLYSEASYSCDFDTDLCSWEQDQQTDQQDFLWNSGKCGTWGPNEAHVTGGHYLCMDTAHSLAQNVVARLISPVFVPQVHINRVLRFWYYKNVLGNSGFRVYLMLNGNLDPNPVWEENSRGTDWRKAEINIDGRSQFQVVLEGFRSGGNLLDLAIDDVTIVDPDQNECSSNPCMNNGVCNDGLFSYTCACRPQWVGAHCSYGIGSCDFEEPLSNYVYLQDDADDFDWTVVSVANRRPSTDHTTGTGSYAYIGSTGGSSGDKARLLSPSLPTTAASCLQFWYYMSGAGVASLNVYTRQQQQPDVLVTNITGDQGDQWRMKEVELVSSSDYMIVFEGIKGTGLNRDIAIDDISLTNGACTSPEFNDCSSSPCLNNGVCVDGLGQYSCTCTSGWYGNRCESNSVVCANSPCQNGGTCVPSGGSFICRCLVGWSGQYCQIDTNECSSNPCVHGQCIDLVNGYNCDCEPGWIGTRCNQDIDECASSPCQNGGVCTDQVNGYVCSCTSGFTGTNCDLIEITIAPQTPYRCDFDTNNCGFVQATDDDADFVRLTGKCGNYGAPADHTTGQNGYYMCLESTLTPDTMAAMYSPTFVTTSPRKLRFWFYKNTIGDSFMELTITTHGSTGQPNNVVWTADDRSLDWRMAELDVPAGRFELTFRGVKNGYRSTDFGFDDIQILDPNTNECASLPCQNGGICTDGDFTFTCTCRPPYTGALCETDHDYCSSQPCSNGGTCLDLQDGHSCICPVGFGGDDCTRYVLQDDVLYLCDLENGLCGWEQMSSPDDTADFTVIPSGKCGISGPDGDRTTGTGSYVCMPTGARNGRARLRSPVFTTTGNVGRTLSFWYYKNTPGDSTLRVYLMLDDNAPVGQYVWSATGQSDEWRRGRVDVNDTTQFRV
ncbi:MAM and LDL-receptor class A domain-containing protein 2-like [Branchiostoma floridae x Branchiostoma belcheri]